MVLTYLIFKLKLLILGQALVRFNRLANIEVSLFYWLNKSIKKLLEDCFATKSKENRFLLNKHPTAHFRQGSNNLQLSREPSKWCLYLLCCPPMEISFSPLITHLFPLLIIALQLSSSKYQLSTSHTHFSIWTCSFIYLFSCLFT